MRREAKHGLQLFWNPILIRGDGWNGESPQQYGIKLFAGSILAGLVVIEDKLRLHCQTHLFSRGLNNLQEIRIAQKGNCSSRL